MENLIFGLGVMVIGLLVVFLGLIILIVFIKVLSFITDRTTGEKKPEKAKPAAPVVSAPPVAAPAPAVSEGVSAEMIAAITAAIAAVWRRPPDLWCAMSSASATRPPGTARAARNRPTAASDFQRNHCIC